MKLRPLHANRKRGIALMDALIGGIMLSIGFSTLLSVNTRAFKTQLQGEKKMQAAWLADEIMNMIMIESPEEYLKTHSGDGSFPPPFDQFSYDVEIGSRQGTSQPFDVSVIVFWDNGKRSFELESAIAAITYREGEELVERAPLEYVDRDLRWDMILNPVDPEDNASGASNGL